MKYYDVTIIVPVYNAEKYIEKCVESIQQQKTVLSYCIILINDGSTDSSLEKCEKLSLNNDHIYVYDKCNGGTSSAKNLGIDKSNSKYIMFVDSDDYIDDLYVSSLLTNDSDLDLYSSGYTIIYDNSNLRILNLPTDFSSTKKDTENLLKAFKSEGLLNVDVGKAYKLDILNKYNIRFPIDMTTGEDLVFNCMYFSRINSFKILSESHYFYIRRDIESLVNSYKSNLSDMVKKSLKNVSLLYEGHTTNENYSYLCNIYFDYKFVEVINMFRPKCDLSSREKRKRMQIIFLDEKLKDYAQNCTRDDTFSKIFKWCIKQKQIYISYMVLYYLFFIRYKFSIVYYYIRDKMILKKKEG